MLYVTSGFFGWLSFLKLFANEQNFVDLTQPTLDLHETLYNKVSLYYSQI